MVVTGVYPGFIKMYLIHFDMYNIYFWNTNNFAIINSIIKILIKFRDLMQIKIYN
jgi:hypothetical protein